MAQPTENYVIGNQSAPDFRADLNDIIEAILTISSASSEPPETYVNMLWYDTANNILKMRSEADDAWISIGYLDQTANAFRVLDDTQVVNTSGSQTGLIGDQSTATWEAGTSTTESLVSPAKVKAASGSTLLGTLTTTSGTIQTLSGLSLTKYNRIVCSISGVTHNHTSSSSLQLQSQNIASINPGFSFNFSMTAMLDGSGTFNAAFTGGGTGLTTSSTSLSFSMSSGSFTAGTIKVYGVV